MTRPWSIVHADGRGWTDGELAGRFAEWFPGAVPALVVDGDGEVCMIGAHGGLVPVGDADMEAI